MNKYTSDKIQQLVNNTIAENKTKDINETAQAYIRNVWRAYLECGGIPAVSTQINYILCNIHDRRLRVALTELQDRLMNEFLYGGDEQ